MTTTQQSTRSRSATLDGLCIDKPIPLRLTASERDEALQAADEQGRSASNFARLIYRMGMQQFRRTGRIQLEPESLIQPPLTTPVQG
ncbi:hypothetical protein KUF54_03075 [Comamonas sp. Y33R10-2]|uniref:hypothetical protein n=1 Tax=Comamonas sp. Y33R10-2 TaxID=2853257 RepID=UPI001C5C859A|nr:hypothetical protein [Comamonas sp. Y33R10-2]QXZ10256.1 hypothetical protein KUF54_03075 [Comamonas sp. Y33R10-2]